MTDDTRRIIGELMEFEKALGWFNTGFGSLSKGQRTIDRVISHFGQLEQRISDLERQLNSVQKPNSTDSDPLKHHF